MPECMQMVLSCILYQYYIGDEISLCMVLCACAIHSRNAMFFGERSLLYYHVMNDIVDDVITWLLCTMRSCIYYGFCGEVIPLNRCINTWPMMLHITRGHMMGDMARDIYDMCSTRLHTEVDYGLCLLYTTNMDWILRGNIPFVISKCCNTLCISYPDFTQICLIELYLNRKHQTLINHPWGSNLKGRYVWGFYCPHMRGCVREMFTWFVTIICGHLHAFGHCIVHFTCIHVYKN